MPAAGAKRPLAAAGSDAGRERENNEDRVLCEPERGMYAVIDGVGGESGGEIAAQTALEILKARLSRRTTDAARLIREAIALANKQIYDRAQTNPALAGMACVLTVAVVDDGQVTIGHVGDSRLYLLRHGEIRKVTRDHSPVGAREDVGEISEEEAMRHPRRNEIFRDVGSSPHQPDEEGFIDLTRIPFEPDAALLLCSDGLSDLVSSQGILSVAEAHAGDPHAAVKELIAQANAAGGKDNVSVVLVEGERYASDVRGRRPTSAMTATAANTAARPRLRGAASAARPGGVRRFLRAITGRPAFLLYGLLLGAGAFAFAQGRLFPGGFSGGDKGAGVLRVGVGDGGFATLGEALDKARPGQRVEVVPGEYRETRAAPRRRPPGEPGAPRRRDPAAGGQRRAGGDGAGDRRRALRRIPHRGRRPGAPPDRAPPRGFVGGDRGRRDLGRGGGRNRRLRRGPLDPPLLLRSRQSGRRRAGGERRRAAPAPQPDRPQRPAARRPGAAGRRGARGSPAGADRQPHRGQRRRRRDAARGGRPRRRGLRLEPLRRRPPRRRRAHARAAAAHAAVARDADARDTDTAPRTGPLMLTQQQVDRFELRDFLGRGAIGDVYLAHDPETDREVAIKVVRTHHTDADMLEAEKNGVSLQQQISQVAPQVATVYEWGEHRDLFWVAMEYVDGTDLSQALGRGPLPEDRAAFIAHQLCEMLEACHQFSAEIAGRKVYGIVHGDIKPENIRLQDGDRVRVLDFGIAKHLSQTRRFTVNLFGSLPYTPPERLDRGGVDRHSDLWAVGVVLYLMVAGYPPFTGDDPEEVEGKIRSGEPPRPLPDSVSPGLRKIIYRSLAFDPARRYPTAVELKADLEAWDEGRPLPSETPDAERPAAADLNATRRTSRPPGTSGTSLDDSGSFQSSETRRTDRGAPRDVAMDATRRTGAPPAELPPLPAAPALGSTPMPAPAIAAMAAMPTTPAAVPRPAAPEPPPAPPPAARRRMRMQGAGLLLVAAGCLLLAAQVWVRSEAAEIRHDLATEASPDLDALWTRYQRVAAFGLPGSGVAGLRQEMRDALLKSANRILESYHGDNPTTTQRGWQAALDRLKGAVDLDYGDRETRAKMLYARGHLARIEAQTLRSGGQRDEAREKIRDAIGEFRDAARLAPTWPDPYLGLARIYAYEQFNLKELEKALSELERRGYPLGRREKAMLADGYRMQAQQLLAQAVRARDTDAEVELLEGARDHFTQAIGLYRDAGNFANAKRNMTDAAEQLRGILGRLEELGIW